jgi:hypothetical protein
MSVILLNSVLLVAPAFTGSLPVLVSDKRVVLDFTLVTPGGVAIEWYPEFTDGGTNLATAPWFREVSEEDIGNGDVRMNEVIRRFSTYNADAFLPAGTHRYSVQLQRTHAIYRVQIRGAGVVATIASPFGKLATA